MNTELIFRLISTLIVLLIIGAMVVVVLRPFIIRLIHGVQVPGPDLDQLISRQKELLANTGHGPLEEFFATSPDLPAFRELFDNYRWGFGEKYQYIINKLQAQYSLSVIPSEITTAINTINQRNFLAKMSNNLSFHQLEELVFALIFIQNTLKIIRKKNGKLLEPLALRYKFSTEIFQQAVLLIILQHSSLSQEQIFCAIFEMDASILDAISSVQQCFRQLILENKDRLSISQLEQEIQQRGQWLEQLALIPCVENHTDAQQLFQLPANFCSQELEQAYSLMQQKKSPLNTHNLPAIVQQRIEINIQHLTDAYNILAKELL